MSRRRLLFLAAFGVIVLLGGCAWAASGAFRSSWSTAAAADPRLEIVAGVGFMAALLATACSWRLAFRTIGSPIDHTGACAAYAAGSLVNMVSPARIGDGVRAALFARSLRSQPGRALSAAGAVGAIALSRALAHTVLLGTGVALGAFPLWPFVALGAAVLAVAVAAAVLSSRRGPRCLPARLFAATVVLIRRPQLGLRLVCWSLVAVAGRFAAAAAVVSSLGLPHPLLSALAITGALDLAGLVPLTPGGIGVTTGVVSLAVAAHGAGSATAVATGLVFQAVETLSGVVFAGTVLPLAACPPRARAALRVAGAVAVVSICAAVGMPAVLDVG